METKNYAAENPREIFTNFSGKEENRVTFAVECHMNPAKVGDKITPQVLFGQFTRVVFNLLRSGVRVKANINFDEIPDIEARTAFARSKVYENEFSGMPDAASAQDATQQEPAYNTKFVMGPFKGRTPADVVSEDPEGNREKLREQYEFLKGNAEKYPANKKLMAAITNAYELHAAGKLGKKAVKQMPGRSFEIYRSGYRPLMREKRSDGMAKVKEMVINCNIGNRYPIEITITEYYAPVTSVNGRLNVQAAATDQTSVQKITAYMAMKDWNCLLSKIEEQKLAFIAAHAKDLLEEADTLFNAKFQQQKAAV